MENELADFIKVMNRLERVLPTLMPMAATVAVNFSKERFRAQNWVGNTTQPWKQRKPNKYDKRKGRATLVNKAILKRDVHKIYISTNRAIIGTTRLTAGYAKAHNEGFKGTVTVKAHTRSRFKSVKEKYTTRSGKERTRTSKQVDTSKGSITVRTHNMKMNLPQRRFLGASPVMDKQIERAITAAFIKTLKGT